MIENDTFTLGGHTFSSRFILGSGKYNLDLIRAAVSDAGAQIITLAVRRANTKDSEKPASGNVEALQHKDPQGRKYPCLPDFQLDGKRHLAVH